MPEPSSGALDALEPPVVPVVPQPPLAPPAGPPTFDATRAFEPVAVPPTVPAGPAAIVPPTPPKAKPFISKLTALGITAGVLVTILTVGVIALAAKADRLEGELTTVKADLTAKTSEADGLRDRVSTLKADKSRLINEKTDLETSNDLLAEFGATVSGLVVDLNACVDGHEQFISDLADGDYWSTSRIRSLATRCEQAQQDAAALDSLLTS